MFTVCLFLFFLISRVAMVLRLVGYLLTRAKLVPGTVVEFFKIVIVKGQTMRK